MRHVIGSTVAFAVFLGGCAFTVPYAIPEDPDSPTIMVNAPANGGFSVFLNGEDCSGYANLPDEFFADGRLQRPFPAVADKPIAIGVIERGTSDVDGVLHLTSCEVIQSFTPKSKTDYVINQVSGSRACAVIITATHRDSGDEFVVLDAVTREATPGLSPNSAHCKTLM